MMTDLANSNCFFASFPNAARQFPVQVALENCDGASPGRGKRGGTRIIYFVAVSRYRILLLDIYAKNEKEDLSHSELKNLKRAVEMWLSEK